MYVDSDRKRQVHYMHVFNMFITTLFVIYISSNQAAIESYPNPFPFPSQLIKIRIGHEVLFIFKFATDLKIKESASLPREASALLSPTHLTPKKSSKANNHLFRALVPKKIIASFVTF